MLPYLLMLVTLVLACLKVTIQGTLTRTFLKNTTDMIFYNVLVFFLIGAVYLVATLPGFPSWVTVGYAVFFGLFGAGFQILYTMALKAGPVSVTVLITSLSVGITTIFGLFHYHEHLAVPGILGLICLAASLLLSVNLREARRSRFSGKWLLLSVGAMVCNGLTGVITKLHGDAPGHSGNNAYMAVAYLVGGLMLLAIWLTHRRKEPQTVPTAPKYILSMLSVGVVLCIYLPLYLYVMQLFDVSVFFPVQSAGSTTLISLTGILLFKDRLKPAQYVGLALGAAAVVLLAL